jgi:peptide/nickel transport system permease protein
VITYIVRRLLLLLPLLLAVSLLSFGIMLMAPGSYVDTLKQNPNYKQETIRTFEINFGFKDRSGRPVPGWKRYRRWLLGGCTPGARPAAPDAGRIGRWWQGVAASTDRRACRIDIQVDGQSGELITGSAPRPAGAPADAGPPDQPAVAKSDAARTALQSVPDGQIRRAGLAKKAGRWVYTFNIITGDHFERGAIVGNLGNSFEYKQPVLAMIKSRAVATFLLALCATFIAWSIAVPLGILSATRQYSFTDMGLTVFGFLGLSIPSVVSSLVFLLLAARSNGWFPTGDMQRVYASEEPWWWQAGDIAWHLILPAFALGVISIAPYMRQMRGQMLETLNSDYIRTARAKGLKESTVVWRHAVRNAINPMITLFGYSLASLLSGSFVIEIVMNWPGLAPLTLNAILKNDVPLVMADLLIAAFLLVLGNLVADLMLAWADPRIKLA